MDEGPARQGHIARIEIAVGEFCGLDSLPKDVETGIACFVQGRMPGFFLYHRAEHQLEEARLLACEKNVGDT